MSGLIPDAFGHDPSATAAFAALPELPPSDKPKRKLKAVVVGGGTGAPVSIRTLLSMGIETDAVVAMADDGGSTGILRDQAGATAPGDIRKCITAMAGSPDDPLTQAFKMRFGFAENHTLGNLMLSALEVTSGGFPQAIQICEQLLGARGHVYPSTLNRVTLSAQTRDGRLLEGQAVANHSRTALRKVALCSEGKLEAYQPALDVIASADLIVLGPGSLFTSIIPNLLVPGVVESISESNAIVVFVCSLADMQGETRGMGVVDHYQALLDHGMKNLVDYIFVHDMTNVGDTLSDEENYDDSIVRPVMVYRGDLTKIRSCGTEVIFANLADELHPTWHDPQKLRRAFSEVLNSKPSSSGPVPKPKEDAPSSRNPFARFIR